MQEELDKIQQAGVELVAISYDPVETLFEFGKAAKLMYPLLSDPDSKVIDAYGLRNKQVEGDARQSGIPHPGTILVDQDGIVRKKIFYSIVKRHAPQELVEAVASIGRETNSE